MPNVHRTPASRSIIFNDGHWLSNSVSASTRPPSPSPTSSPASPGPPGAMAPLSIPIRLPPDPFPPTHSQPLNTSTRSMDAQEKQRSSWHRRSDRLEDKAVNPPERGQARLQRLALPTRLSMKARTEL